MQINTLKEIPYTGNKLFLTAKIVDELLKIIY